MLELHDLSVRYGEVEAVRNVNMVVEKGKIVSLIGPNGAGKTSILKCISGLIAAYSGKILFEGDDITNLSPKDIVRRGIVHVPEGRRLFPYMSVMANLKLGAYLRKDKERIEEDLEWVFQLFPRLRERTKQAAGTLSGGEQQMLAIARALMSRPRMLLMDEPSLGLAPLVVEHLLEAIREINSKREITILLAEQNASLVLGLSHKTYVLEIGEVVVEGPTEAIMDREEVKRAFLG